MYTLDRLSYNSNANPKCKPQALPNTSRQSTVCHAKNHKRTLNANPGTPQSRDATPIHSKDATPNSFLATARRTAFAFITSAALVLSPGPSPDLTGGPAIAAEAYSVAAYESAVAGRKVDGSDGPNLSLFTDDAKQAMERLQEYAHYVESVAPAESACGSSCSENREVLEAAWQVVANEHYSASGVFSQADWADRLMGELQSRGGLLPTKSDLQSALSALMAALADPYSEFLPPSAFRRALRRPLPREQSYLRAQYVGLGLELGPRCPEGGVMVLAPLAGSPAEAAGIARGDRLIAVDGTLVDQLSPEQIRGLMRGPAGSTATLEWAPATATTTSTTNTTAPSTAHLATTNSSTSAAVPRGAPAAAAAVVMSSTGSSAAVGAASMAAAAAVTGGAGAASYDASRSHVGHVVMDVERRDLPQPAVQVSTLPLGPPSFYATYIRLMYWGSETTEGLVAALRRYEAVPGNVGYIIDLRNNPGGVFEEAIAAASLFLTPGQVVAKTIRGPEEVVDTVWQVGNLPEEVMSSLPGHLASKPVVLLANRSTASASEVFAGALRDNGRATLMGERTFGKGLVQYYFPLREGKDGGLRVTVAKYLTPSGYDISAKRAGLAPDLVCRDFPHGGPPSSLQRSDECIMGAAELLGEGL